MSGRFDAVADTAVRLPDGSTRDGPIVDLRDVELGPSRGALDRVVCAGCPTTSGTLAVHSPPPQSVHRHVSPLTPATTLDRRAALAALAAARGVETPYDDDLRTARRSLRSAAPAAVGVAELRTARRRAAEAGAETERLRERVATIRGRVNALRDADHGTSDDGLAEAEASLSETTRRLSEVATERVAAAQRLELLERNARSARDTRDARLRLEDRAGNLERAVRDARIAAVEDDFRAARRTVSARLSRTRPPDPAVSTGVCDALAVARGAPIRAPVVVAPDLVGALGGPTSTHDVLDAPILIC
ncbi:hypothetical protein [Halobellus inordinatus]|uniref:DUF7856 family protein n=1 Tax=Halobellus inordinatus TaxID=1126236 RepID=UPI00210E35AC|nr:hypothetical protein [Halobellus inordinatus]